MEVMEKIFKVSELIGTDIRSRSNAEIIRRAIDGVKGEIVLDFSGVSFISSSFTDELCAIMEQSDKIRLSGMTDFVKSMIETVASGRTRKRERHKEDSEMKEFKDIESLSEFLRTI